MPELIVVAGAEVLFEANPGWNWKGWDGKLILRSTSKGLSVDENRAAIAKDFVLLARELIGKRYAAIAFADKLGTVMSANVEVDNSSLAKNATTMGDQVATSTTKGTFTLVCEPSFKSGSPPVPDPEATKRSGKWSITRTGQAKFSVQK